MKWKIRAKMDKVGRIMRQKRPEKWTRDWEKEKERERITGRSFRTESYENVFMSYLFASFLHWTNIVWWDFQFFSLFSVVVVVVGCVYVVFQSRCLCHFYRTLTVLLLHNAPNIISVDVISCSCHLSYLSLPAHSLHVYLSNGQSFM